ncbi:UNVERIFIED_CONTAM: hypothetical protein FKN15_022516 [Acipenser sinensis]
MIFLAVLNKSTSLEIPVSACRRSLSPTVRRVKKSRQAWDIMDMKAQIARIMELLERPQPRLRTHPQTCLRATVLPPDPPWGNRVCRRNERCALMRTRFLLRPRGGSPPLRQRWRLRQSLGSSL